MGMVTHPHITADDDGFSAQQASDDTFNQKSRQGACGQRQPPKGPKAQVIHLLTSRHSWFAHSAPYIESAAQMLRIQFIKVGLHQKPAPETVTRNRWAAPEESQKKGPEERIHQSWAAPEERPEESALGSKDKAALQPLLRSRECRLFRPCVGFYTKSTLFVAAQLL